MKPRIQVGQLSHAVDQSGDLGAIPGFHLFQRDATIFDHIVEQCGDDGIGIQAQVREKEGCFQGMGDVGFA